MIKKNFKFILVVLTFTLLFTGCTKTSDKSNVNDKKINDMTVVSRNEKPDIYGKVKSIIGNEAALELAEIPQRENGQMSEDEKEKMKSQMQNMSDEKGQQMRQMSVNFTGETKNIIIPVGIPITSVKRGEATQLELSDIYEGVFLQIYLNEDETVKSVQVMQGR